MAKTIIDSAIWSLLFRKKNLDEKDLVIVNKVKELTKDDEVIMLGSVRQEALCGISSKEKFEKIKNALDIYDDFVISKSDYINAAEFFNLCRSHGIQGSHTDFLICSVAKSNGFEIFTTDNDFSNYSQFVDIKLTAL